MSAMSYVNIGGQKTPPVSEPSPPPWSLEDFDNCNHGNHGNHGNHRLTDEPSPYRPTLDDNGNVLCKFQLQPDTDGETNGLLDRHHGYDAAKTRHHVLTNGCSEHKSSKHRTEECTQSLDRKRKSSKRQNHQRHSIEINVNRQPPPPVKKRLGNFIDVETTYISPYMPPDKCISPSTDNSDNTSYNSNGCDGCDGCDDCRSSFFSETSNGTPCGTQNGTPNGTPCKSPCGTPSGTPRVPVIFCNAAPDEDDDDDDDDDDDVSLGDDSYTDVQQCLWDQLYPPTPAPMTSRGTRLSLLPTILEVSREDVTPPYDVTMAREDGHVVKEKMGYRYIIQLGGVMFLGAVMVVGVMCWVFSPAIFS